MARPLDAVLSALGCNHPVVKSTARVCWSPLDRLRDTDAARCVDPGESRRASCPASYRVEVGGQQTRGCGFHHWVGYDPRRQTASSGRAMMGLIPPDAWLDLSYPSYYDWFLNECVLMIQSNAVNYFKWDKATDGAVPHTMALFAAADELHRQSPQVYLNATAGTCLRRFGTILTVRGGRWH